MHASLYITSLVAISLVPLLIVLSFRVIQYRRKNKISLGHNDDRELIKRTRAHANFIEYTPFFLVLLALCESQQANSNVLLIIGLIFVIGRYIHASGVSKTNFKLRVPGMIMTFFSIIASGLVLLTLLAENYL